jgi:hypothetical protein
MGFGYVLGGIAKGLQEQDELAQKQQVANAAAAKADAQLAMTAKSLSLKEQSLADAKDRNVQSQVNKHIADSVKVITQIIKNGQATGTPPDKLMNAVAPLLDDVDAWGLRIGSDTSKLRTGILNLVQAGAKAPTKVGATLEDIKANYAATGKFQNAAQERLYRDSLHQDAVEAAIKDALEGINGATPAEQKPNASSIAPTSTSAPAPTPVQTQTIAAPGPATPAGTGGGAPMPPTPASLANKPGLAWSPSRQKFYDAQGNAYNQQGVPVTP